MEQKAQGQGRHGLGFRQKDRTRNIGPAGAGREIHQIKS
jgi:hypothetical protein